MVEAEVGRAESALHSGATSLEIGIDTFGGSFSAGELAARRHVSPSWAVRLAGSAGTEDGHADMLDLQNGNVYPGSSDADQTSWALTAQGVWFPVREDDIALLLAVGPKYSRYHSKRSDEQDSFGGGVARIIGQDETKSHSIGLALDLGFEWFVSRHVALHARTGTTYSHNEGQTGFLRTYYDSNGQVVQQSGRASESKTNSFDTVGFGLRIVGYF